MESFRKEIRPALAACTQFGDHDVAKLYDVKDYPTKIVVDKNGNIAKVILGEAPAFYSYLDELFK